MRFESKRILLVLLTSALLLLAIILGNIHAEIWMLLLFMASILFYMASNLEKHILIFLLFITFVVFDMGMYFSHLFDFTSWWKNIQGSMTEYSFEDATLTLSITILGVSILMILIGYHISDKFVFMGKKNSEMNFEKSDARLEKVKGHAKVIFYLTTIGNLLSYLYKAYMVFTVSYVYLYTDFSEIWFLKMCSLVWYVAFYCYIATFPRKDEIKKVVVIYIICSVASLLTGARGTAISNLLFLVFYYLIRQRYSEDRWAPRNVILKIVVALPAIMIILGIIGTLRQGNTIENGILSYGSQLFASQGESGMLLPETIENLDRFRFENINFTFGKLLNNIQHNTTLSNMLGLHSLDGIAPQTADYAIYGNQFGSAISYYKMRYTYLSGYSMGTYYLAEIWADYRWIGVILLNTILGFFVGKLSKIAYSSFTIRCIAFGVITQLLLIGRFSITNILLFFMSTAVLVMYLFFIFDYKWFRH
ncbi:O-antigen polysaccharide polymerase Wzy family protein [Blautia schinkii]|nr:O-antigen polysaccharide polymerase Wzy family protein [Blautia schinkii]